MLTLVPVRYGFQTNRSCHSHIIMMMLWSTSAAMTQSVFCSNFDFETLSEGALQSLVTTNNPTPISKQKIIFFWNTKIYTFYEKHRLTNILNHIAIAQHPHHWLPKFNNTQIKSYRIHIHISSHSNNDELLQMHPLTCHFRFLCRRGWFFLESFCAFSRRLTSQKYSNRERCQVKPLEQALFCKGRLR